MAVRTMLADGSDPRQVTPDGQADQLPAWSPDGSRLLFSRTISRPAGVDGDLYVVRSDGTGLAPLRSSSSNEGNGDWSADGTRIVYELGFGIAVADADGSGEAVLVSGAFRNGSFGPRWVRR